MRSSAELADLWHAHRIPLLLSAAAIVGLVRLVVFLRRKSASGPAIPISVASTEEEPVRLDPKWMFDSAAFPPNAPLKGQNESTAAGPLEVKASRSKLGPKQIRGRKFQPKTLKATSAFDHATDKIQCLVFFSSISGTTERFAQCFVKDLNAWISALPSSPLLAAQLHDLSYTEFDDFFVNLPTSMSHRNAKPFYFILFPTYEIDTVLNLFLESLQETHNDFRIDTAPLRSLLGYSVFGLGDGEGWPTEEEGFCAQAKEVDKWMAKLTNRKRAYPLGMGDIKSNAADQLHEWRRGVQDALTEICAGKGLGEGVPGSGDAAESDEDYGVGSPSEGPRRSRRSKEATSLGDLEDLGAPAAALGRGKKSTAVDLATSQITNPGPMLKEMVPAQSPTHAALTKQGYSIIGSHSGVKICRWTKSALRGRGSCYKYSFYGIASHLCMEATPSLSCSNKCVFCWRHGTNPVGTTWRWVTDPPDAIFDGITTAHYQKIKMLKGVPGVRAERFAEAQRIRHCALSLVGEPIFYPHINDLVHILHAHRISTFLVCNAQHPAQLASLVPVTQLYVSIDASNRASLRKIDRPLHRDFWERFTACLDILRARRFEQRTVFRLTLVKGFNMADEVRGYADLVARALPGLVEVKGVTFCGTPAAGSAGLTMQNVPFYAEVCDFVAQLAAELQRRGLRYGLAAEHAHSCCALLADEGRFVRHGRWATRIDFDGFFDLYEGKRSGSRLDTNGHVVGWRPEDYLGEDTPEWALWGNGGFDPRDVRFRRKGKGGGGESVQGHEEGG